MAYKHDLKVSVKYKCRTNITVPCYHVSLETIMKGNFTATCHQAIKAPDQELFAILPICFACIHCTMREGSYLIFYQTSLHAANAKCCQRHKDPWLLSCLFHYIFYKLSVWTRLLLLLVLLHIIYCASCHGKSW